MLLIPSTAVWSWNPRWRTVSADSNCACGRAIWPPSRWAAVGDSRPHCAGRRPGSPEMTDEWKPGSLMPVYWCGGSLEAGIVNLIETFNFAGRKKERKGKKKPSLNGCGSALTWKARLMQRLWRDVREQRRADHLSLEPLAAADGEQSKCLKTIQAGRIENLIQF